jgi:hypothetical protein
VVSLVLLVLFTKIKQNSIISKIQTWGGCWKENTFSLSLTEAKVHGDNGLVKGSAKSTVGTWSIMSCLARTFLQTKWMSSSVWLVLECKIGLWEGYMNNIGYTLILRAPDCCFFELHDTRFGPRIMPGPNVDQIVMPLELELMGIATKHKKIYICWSNWKHKDQSTM